MDSEMPTENMPEKIPNERLRAANNGTAKLLEWCEDRATSLGHEGNEILHQCRYENGHEGHEHACWLCRFTWYSEVTC